jgi:hypothetical protein
MKDKYETSVQAAMDSLNALERVIASDPKSTPSLCRVTVLGKSFKHTPRGIVAVALDRSTLTGPFQADCSVAWVAFREKEINHPSFHELAKRRFDDALRNFHSCTLAQDVHLQSSIERSLAVS